MLDKEKLNLPETPTDPHSAMLRELIAQVTLSNNTLQLSVDRINVVANQQSDAYTEIKALSEQLVTLKENLVTGLEAVHRIASELDRSLDDLARITVRIGQMEQTYQQALQAANEG